MVFVVWRPGDQPDEPVYFYPFLLCRFVFFFPFHFYLLLLIVAAMKQPPATDPDSDARANAAIISLVRNSELDGMLSSMRQFESSFNARYSYPWVFFNNEPFSEEFKERTQAETKAQCTYGASVI